MYGYQLIKKAGKKSKGYFRSREGTAYSALYRLEKEGLVHGEWQELQDGQERKYYYITKKGELALK
ncbi:PadR family transcriptional regulator [Chloroflexota bacterium]